MIKLFCKGLPGRLSNLLYNEYQNYEKELKFLLENYKDKYAWTKKINYEFFELFISLSIFYRRVIAQLDSASDFTERFLLSKGTEGICIGNYLLDKTENDKINDTISDFWDLCSKYIITPSLFDFDNITKFLYKFKNYYDDIEVYVDETEKPF